MARSLDSPSGPAPAAEMSFERALARLEEVVERLERGDLELEDSLAVFEEGVRLTRQCSAQLEAAERRIETLVREGHEWVARPLDVDDGDPPDDESTD